MSNVTFPCGRGEECMYDELMEKVEKTQKELRADMDARFDKLSRFSRWVAGLLATSVVSFTILIIATLSSTGGRITDHALDTDAHSTKYERRLAEKSEREWKESIGRRLESIELKLDRIGPGGR